MEIVIPKDKDMGGITRCLIFNKTYEPLTTEILLPLLKPDMKAIDIGANIGYFTLLLAKHTNHVWAFEPEKNNFESLKNNVVLNNLTNVTTLNKAVSDKNGKRRLYISKEEPGAHSLNKVRRYKNYQMVETISIDQRFPTELIDIIKTDTEGHDLNVILGAQNLINRSRNFILITELWIDGFYSQGKDPSEMFKLLDKLQFYDIMIIDENLHKVTKGTLEEAIKNHRKHGQAVNLICKK